MLDLVSPGMGCGTGLLRGGRLRVPSLGRGLDQVLGRRTCSWRLRTLALVKAQGVGELMATNVPVSLPQTPGCLHLAAAMH